MSMHRLDLLQFHWWDYGNSAYLDALAHLSDLRDEGKIRALALTNLDTRRMQEIADYGVRIASNQVQYSLVDRRPEVAMAEFCQSSGVSLLTYGTLCGGFLSDRFFGQPEPVPSTLNTASLRKYKQMIDAWGGWELFQQLLAVLRSIADKHAITIANLAVRYVLDRPAVAGVIIGARLGQAEHIGENTKVFSIQLDAEDLEAIDQVLGQS